MPHPRQGRVHGSAVRAVRAPVRRLTPYAQTGPAVDTPAPNSSGMPKTPSDVDLPDAHGDTDTMPWNEAWDASGKPKKTPEDPDDPSRVEVQAEDSGKPHEMPGLDDSTKATHIDIKEGSGVEIQHFGDTAPVPLDNQGDKGDDAPGAFGGIVDALDLAASKANTHRIDNPPSPADVPDDMKYDPGGEATPGLMPPIPAPVPGVDDADDSVTKGLSSDSLIAPLGGGDDD